MRADTYHSGEHGREGILGSLTQARDIDNSTQAQQSILEEKKEHGSFYLVAQAESQAQGLSDEPKT